MRILYGVTGHGTGHAMRALVLAEHLRTRGHPLLLAASGRAAKLLRARGHEVTDIEGLALRYVRGGVARTRSLFRILGKAPRALAHNVDRYVNEVSRFEPEAVISDFDSFSHLAGLARQIPVASFDHQHVLTRCELGAVEPQVAIARALVGAKMAGCAHYFVSSFYRPEIKPEHAATTTLVGPILRSDVLERRATHGEHVVVYQTSAGHRRLLGALRELRGHRFIVYGAGREGRERHIEYRTFDPDRFLDELASARALITHGGHTAISEALHFGKPVISVPLRGQGEQLLNAEMLERTRAGRRIGRPNARLIERALATLSVSARSASIEPGNRALVESVDRWLATLARPSGVRSVPWAA
ncbi:MAG: glycosyltransferase family protein [Sandaracinaceae bacterium]